MLLIKPHRQYLSVPLAAGLILLFSLGLTYSLSILQLIAGSSLWRYTFPLSLLLSVSIILLYCNFLNTAKATVLSLLISIAAIFISSFFPDYSYDGQWYHLDTVSSLADGWNPIRDQGYAEKNSLTEWSIHYAKALEVISAAIFMFTADIETGKSVNLLLIVASGLICWQIFKGVNPLIPKFRRGIFVFILIANPIALCQLFSFYIDYACYYYIILTLALSIALCKAKNSHLCAIGLSLVIIFAIGTKFNHFFYEGITIASILLWLFINRYKTEFKTILLVSSISTLVGIIFFGFHPYITNLLNCGNPFYPLMGDNAREIMDFNTPDCFVGNNRFINFFISNFGKIKAPTVDSRIMGFGPSFAVLLSVSIFIIFIHEIKQHRLTIIGFTGLIVLVSAFFFEQSWWARYIPQLWLLIPLSYICIADKNGPAIKIANVFLIVAVLINSMICLGTGLYFSYRTKLYRDTVFQTLSGKCIRANIRQFRIEELRKHKIEAIFVEIEQIPENQRLYLCENQQWHLPFQIIECDSITRNSIDSILNMNVLYSSNLPSSNH